MPLSTVIRKINTLLSVCAVCDDAISIRHLLIVILRTALIAMTFRNYTSPKLQHVQRWIDSIILKIAVLSSLVNIFTTILST